MTIATTRPETLFGDVAIAVNPEVSEKESIPCVLLQLTSPIPKYSNF